jgi:hypothetical protein
MHKREFFGQAFVYKEINSEPRPGRGRVVVISAGEGTVNFFCVENGAHGAK